MKKINFKYQVAAGVILIISGIPLLLSNYIKEKRDVVFSEMNLALSEINSQTIYNDEVVEDEELSDEELSDEELEEEQVEEPKEEYTYEEYAGILDIPKINLYKGFYNKASNLNNVKFNLYVLKESDYPDITNGNLIIAGHSGNYNNSYFANLYQLELNDTIIVHYKNKDYTYKITKIYNEEKTGTVRILRDRNKTTLTLITCTKDDNYHQTIYIAELI